MLTKANIHKRVIHKPSERRNFSTAPGDRRRLYIGGEIIPARCCLVERPPPL